MADAKIDDNYGKTALVVDTNGNPANLKVDPVTGYLLVEFTGAEIGSILLGDNTLIGTDSDMSGANNWTTFLGVDVLDVNTTVPGKMYVLSDGNFPSYIALSNGHAHMEIGKNYFVSVKARLNSGLSTFVRIGEAMGEFVQFTPTGTEATYSGILKSSTGILFIFVLSKDVQAFEYDDVVVKEVIEIPSILNDGKVDENYEYTRTVWDGTVDRPLLINNNDGSLLVDIA